MNITYTNKKFYWGLIITFGLLYFLVAFVSTLHAIDFFKLSNYTSLAILLGVAYEVGQASVLFSILMTKNKDKFLPWILMILLTALQVTANVYASYKHIANSGNNDWTYWYTSILKIFGAQGGSVETYQVIISWISGALLPIVALGMTALVAQNIKLMSEESENDDTNETKKIPADILVSEISKIRPTKEDLKKVDDILNKKNHTTIESILKKDVNETEPITNDTKNVMENYEPEDDDEISDYLDDVVNNLTELTPNLEMKQINGLVNLDLKEPSNKIDVVSEEIHPQVTPIEDLKKK